MTEMRIEILAGCPIKGCTRFLATSVDVDMHLEPGDDPKSDFHRWTVNGLAKAHQLGRHASEGQR